MTRPREHSGGTSQRAGRDRRTVRILLTSSGRRVELLRAFRQAARRLGLKPTLLTADTSWLAPTMHLGDRPRQVPPTHNAAYIPALLDLVKAHRVDLLVPLIDLELVKIARARRRFAEAGCLALISSPGVIETCRDKLLTHDFLGAHGIDTPATWSAPALLRRSRHRFPYFLKPRFGSAGQGNFRITGVDELRVLARRVPDPIVQEFIPGVEHTLDVYTGLDGRPRCIVPRRRIEVRGGEVCKARVVKDQRLIEIGVRVAEALGECRGLITIQCIVTPSGRIPVIEINPRFGGGAPLAIRAGADFPRWLMTEWLGRSPRVRLDGYKDNLVMLRYDDSVFSNSVHGE